MMRRQSQLRKGVVRLLVRAVSASSTMLERAQSTALSLLNRLDSNGENYPEEELESVEVWGCTKCKHIFSAHRVFLPPADNVFIPPRVMNQVGWCPECRGFVTDLGSLPYTVEDGGEVFLTGAGGFTTGPYPSEDVARDHLWTWFAERKERANQSKVHKKEVRKGHLRVVQEEGDQEDDSPSEEGGQGSTETEVNKTPGPEEAGRGQSRKRKGH